MAVVSQTTPAAPRWQYRFVAAIALLAMLPSLAEGYAVVWGARQGFTGSALRDGLDFWAGGFLALHHAAAMLFHPAAYNRFLAGMFSAGGKLPFHLWSYPPSYLLLAAGFGWLPPWPAVLTFDLASLLFLSRILRLAGALIGLASIKPQLGLVLPLHLLARSRAGFAFAVLTAMALAAASLAAFGAESWRAFWHVTRPAMSDVLLTGQPAAFAGGLISVFAACRVMGVDAALAVQALVSATAILLAVRTGNPVIMLILSALASPYLHDYDLLGVTLAVALLVRDRLRHGFSPGEPLLFFIAWAGPGAMPWLPGIAHATPLVLLLLLARAAPRDRLLPCDSTKTAFCAPASSAGR